MSIPSLHIPGSGEPIHFYHANGFPAEVYTPFLNTLAEHFDVHAINGRPIWDDNQNPDHKNWNIFADDLIKYIESTHTQPIIAMGHSMGASCTVFAAIKRPDLFKALVLIEPAMISLPMRMMLKLLPQDSINKSKLVSGTANKPDTWPDRESYKKYIKKFHGYQLFSDTAFDTFMQHGVKETDNNQVTLRYPKQWEAYNYTNPPYLMQHLAKLEKDKWNLPTVAIRGKSNGFFTDKLWRSWQRSQPNAIYLEDICYGHLMPLEGPCETVSLILKGLEDLNKQARIQLLTEAPQADDACLNF